MLRVQGFGILLPTNLRVYFELRNPQPDTAKIQRLMRRYVRVIALQGFTQIALIFVMARFSTSF